MNRIKNYTSKTEFVATKLIQSLIVRSPLRVNIVLFSNFDKTKGGFPIEIKPEIGIL